THAALALLRPGGTAPTPPKAAAPVVLSPASAGELGPAPAARPDGAPAGLPVEPLSRREGQGLEQLAAGRSNSEIAKALYVAPGTVKAHLNHIFRKLAAASRLQAVTHAREAGLLDNADGRKSTGLNPGDGRSADAGRIGSRLASGPAFAPGRRGL